MFLFNALNNISLPNKGKGSPFWSSAFNKTVKKYTGRFQSYKATVKNILFYQACPENPDLLVYITSASIKITICFIQCCGSVFFWASGSGSIRATDPDPSFVKQKQ